MKSPLPLLLVVAIGGALMSLGAKRKNPATDEAPESLDYNSPELRDALADAEDTVEFEGESDGLDE